MEHPTYTFSEPKRKRQRKWQTTSGGECPFPVPIASVLGLPASNAWWNYFKGRLVGTSVYVDDTADADLLYQMVLLLTLSCVVLFIAASVVTVSHIEILVLLFIAVIINCSLFSLCVCPHVCLSVSLSVCWS